METAGFSQAGLDRLRAAMARHIEREELPGLVVGVHRRGWTWVEAIGAAAFGADEPIGNDAIFRVSSFTKPIVAVAAMTFVEACLLRLDEPVDGWLPELADRQVLRMLDGPVDDTVPAERPITLRDLLTSTMGFGLVFGSPDDYPILAAAERLGLRLGSPMELTPHGPDEWLKRLGSLPLMHQPGERWMYTTPSEVLGVLLARVAGRPLDEVLRERVFAPLGMTDTEFIVPPGDIDRLVPAYDADPETGAVTLVDGGEDSLWATRPAFLNGAGGLVSTMADMLAFGRMMLGQGRLGQARLLARPTVALMTTDLLTPAQKDGAILLGDPATHGWGLGMAVITGRDDISSTPGRFGWDGGLGTSWYVDPAEDLTAVMLTQRLFGYPDLGIRDDFWTSVYAAIDD